MFSTSLLILRSQSTGDPACRIQMTVMPSIRKVNDQSDDQPSKKRNPCQSRKACHQVYTTQGTQNRNQWHKWNAEAAFEIRVIFTQHDNAQTYNCKSKQRSDVRKLRQMSQRDEPGEQSHDNACNPCPYRWCLTFATNLGEDRRQQSVTRHGIEQTCLTIHHDQQYGRNAGNRSKRYNPGQTLQLNKFKCKRNRITYIQHVIRHNPCEDQRYNNVENGTDCQ